MCLLPLRFFLAAGAAKDGKRFSPRQGEKHKRLEGSGRCRAIRPPHRINRVWFSFGRKCPSHSGFIGPAVDSGAPRSTPFACRSSASGSGQASALFWPGCCTSGTDSFGAVNRTEPENDRGILRVIGSATSQPGGGQMYEAVVS